MDDFASQPIGVFDSGVGGLSVLRELGRLLPHEDVLYVADQAWAPYGDRTLDEVRARAEQVSGYLIEQGAKIVVVACNSASAAALRGLRERHPGTPFVGMEPAVKPAAASSATGIVGVLATSATFQGELFASVVDRFASNVEVMTRAGKGLADLVEEGRVHSPETKVLLAQYLDPMLDAGMDTLVLACTHYTFLTDVIRSIVGDDVVLVDPSPAVAKQTARVLDEMRLGSRKVTGGTVRFETSGDPVPFANQISDLLGEHAATHGITV